MINRLAGDYARRRACRALALLGSALGSTLIVPAALAQDMNQGNADTTSGGPRTVDVSTSSGNITLDYGTVTAVNNGTATGAAIAATNNGSGTITIKNVNASTSGSGPSNDIEATGKAGAIAIASTGTITSNNAANSRGIVSYSAGGTVAINANQVDGAVNGIAVFTAGGTPPTMTSITSSVVTASGPTMPVAILGNGDQVTINSGTATLTNTAASGGTTIAAIGGTAAGSYGAAITAGTTSALGSNVAALRVLTRRYATVTSGTVRTTQGADGIVIGSVTSATNVALASDAIAIEGGGRGIVLGGAVGSGNSANSPNGFNYLSATLTSGAITTAGANGYGIYLTPTAGTTAVNSRDITTSGSGAYGIYETAIGSGSKALVGSGGNRRPELGQLQIGSFGQWSRTSRSSKACI